MIEEYSRFTFAFVCSNMTTDSQIKCLDQISILFDISAYIYSDRGSSFIYKKNLPVLELPQAEPLLITLKEMVSVRDIIALLGKT